MSYITPLFLLVSERVDACGTSLVCLVTEAPDRDRRVWVGYAKPEEIEHEINLAPGRPVLQTTRSGGDTYIYRTDNEIAYVHAPFEAERRAQIALIDFSGIVLEELAFRETSDYELAKETTLRPRLRKK